MKGQSLSIEQITKSPYYRVLLDGKELDGVVSLTLMMKPGELPKATITVLSRFTLPAVEAEVVVIDDDEAR